jgi:ABC-type nitrate/sulfonate/bicarbonate transport system substrate-binding protein
MRQRALSPVVALTLVAALLACGDDDGDEVTDTTSTDTTAAETTATATTTAATETPAATATTSSGTGGDEMAVTAGQPFPAARCEANRAAGTITYLSGFDFAATASIVDVVVADQKGYFDELCLDVELQPSFSTANYPIVASNDAQFASGGSFSEVVSFAAANDADLVAVAVEGRTAIDALILKPGVAETLADLRGTTIGVKGKISSAVAAMLAGAGLSEGEDYETVLLDGFDPLAHIALDGIVGFPGWKSNEPGQLKRAGVDFDLFDPADYDVPGSFGVIFTNRGFIEDHPTAAQDFLRAAMRGLADAVADPEAASAAAIELVEAGGNPSFLSLEGETFRWTTDAALIAELQPEGTGMGVPDVDALRAEIDAYAEVGLFGDGGVPDIRDRVDADLIAGVYDEQAEVIWPS